MMGRVGGGFWGRSKFAAAGALALALAACGGGPPATMYDLAAATPPQARGLRAQIRVGQPTATANLDSDRILVRDSDTLATLADARWSESLPALFRTRLAQSFQNAGLAHWIDGPAANAGYEIDLDIAAWVVSLGSGRIRANQIFTLSEPVASTDPAAVAAAMDQAASTVMADIVKFVDKTL